MKCRHGFEPRSCAFCDPSKAENMHEAAIGFKCRHHGCHAEPNAPCSRHGKPIKRLHQVRYNDAHRHVSALLKIEKLNSQYGDKTA